MCIFTSPVRMDALERSNDLIVDCFGERALLVVHGTMHKSLYRIRNDKNDLLDDGFRL